MIRNLLPQDSRIAELVSCFGILAVAASLFLDGGITAAMLDLHPPVFWGTLLTVFGALQLISLMLHPYTEPLRVFIAMMNGTWWVWLALTSMGSFQTPSDFGAFFLGVSNLYGSMVGFLFLRQKWVS